MSLSSIDIARALAAFSVLLYHYNVGEILHKKSGFALFELISAPGALYAVPLFFVVSGFCIHNPNVSNTNGENQIKPVKFRKYIITRFFRIYPPYIISIAVSIFVIFMSGKVVNLHDLFMHIFMLQAYSDEFFNSINLVLWTISIEFTFYIMYPIWLNIRIKYGLKVAIAVGLAIQLIAVLFDIYWLYPYSYSTLWFPALTWSAWLFGALLVEIYRNYHFVLRSTTWWVVGLGVYILYIVESNASTMYPAFKIVNIPLRAYLSGWALSGLLMLENFIAHKSTKFSIFYALRIIGLSSYSIYLLHEPLIDLRNNLKKFIPTYYNDYIMFLSFFLILLISFIAYKFIEKPSADWGRKIARFV